jgi:hypothetical protein
MVTPRPPLDIGYPLWERTQTLSGCRLLLIYFGSAERMSDERSRARSSPFMTALLTYY